jgi:hypothetical protein
VDERSTRATLFTPEVFLRRPFRYHGGLRAYVATVGVSVVKQPADDDRDLPQPIVLAFGSTSIDRIEPLQLEFSTAGIPQDVEVRSETVSDDATISVRPSLGGPAVEVPIASRQAPLLSISITRDTILGFGLESGRASVQVEHVLAPGGMEIALEIDRGWLADGGVVRLNERGRGDITIRSVGLGEARLTSRDPVFASVQPDTLRFAPPWLFMAAILIGGTLGTLATREAREGWWKALPAGIATGVIVVAAYAVGINLLGVAPAAVAGEALAGVLAALGAVAGAHVLKPSGIAPPDAAPAPAP